MLVSGITAAACILERHIEIFEYVPGETTLKWEEILAPAHVTVKGPNLQLVRIGDDHYHVGIPQATTVAEAYRRQTAEMMDLLHNGPTKHLQPPQPPPPLPPRPPPVNYNGTLSSSKEKKTKQK